MWERIQRGVRAVLESATAVALTTMLTVWALFKEDIKVVLWVWGVGFRVGDQGLGFRVQV